jgi:hypothetical protein
MTSPEEEQLWIEKYRDAMDARLAKESHRSRIRMAWIRINSALGSTDSIPRGAGIAAVRDEHTRPSTPTAGQRDEFMIDASCEEKKRV